jgi:hypothetical protein
MTSEDDKTQTLFSCVENGRSEMLDDLTAHARVWDADIAYIVSIGWYRYRLGQHSRSFFLSNERVGKNGEKIGKAELELLFALHTRQHDPVVRGDLYDPDCHRTSVSKYGFIKRRSRIGMLFPKGLDPIEVADAIDPRGHGCLAYLLKPSVKKFMIIGIKAGEARFDWTTFLEMADEDSQRRAG